MSTHVQQYQVVEIGLPEKSCRLQAVGSIDLDSESPHNFGKEWRSASMGRSTRSSNRSSRPEAGRRAPGRGSPPCGAVPPGCVPITFLNQRRKGLRFISREEVKGD